VGSLASCSTLALKLNQLISRGIVFFFVIIIGKSNYKQAS
jgi:hypothetical protein